MDPQRVGIWDRNGTKEDKLMYMGVVKALAWFKSARPQPKSLQAGDVKRGGSGGIN